MSHTDGPCGSCRHRGRTERAHRALENAACFPRASTGTFPSNHPRKTPKGPKILTSIFGMLGVDLTAPDHTTLSRRGQHLALALRRARPGTSLHLIVDSTGLSIVGEGEWAAATHGGRGRRGWRKLHLGVDGSRVIVACALTEPTADDAITGISLVDEVDGHLTRVTADPAYDTLACYGAAGARGARVVVPPTKTASLSRRGARSGARDRTIRRVKALGLRAPTPRRPGARDAGRSPPPIQRGPR